MMNLFSVLSAPSFVPRKNEIRSVSKSIVTLERGASSSYNNRKGNDLVMMPVRIQYNKIHHPSIHPFVYILMFSFFNLLKKYIDWCS